MFNFAGTFSKLHDYKEASARINSAIGIQKKADTPNPKLIADGYFELGLYSEKMQGQEDNAIKHYKLALKTYKEIGAEKCAVEISKTMNNIGIVLMEAQ